MSRDLEETPVAYVTRREPAWTSAASKEECSPCYICGRTAFHFASWRKFTVSLHPYCWLFYGGGTSDRLPGS